MFNIAPVYAIWLAVFTTAFNVVISKLAVPYASSALFVFLTCLLGSVCFRLYFGKSNQWKNLFRKDVWPRALMMGTFGTALPMTIFMIALNYTSPVNAAIANQFEIIYSLILSAIILKERPTLKQIGGSVLILIGVGMIILEGGTTLQAKGDLIIISCLWMYQVSHIFAKKLPSDLSPQTIAAARAFYAMPALLVLCIGLFFVQGPLQFNAGSSTLWLVIIASAVINYFIGNCFWYQAIRNMDLSKATAIILSYPVMTYVLSVMFRQDRFTLYKVIGMILAVGGAYVVTLLAKGDKK